MSAKFSKLGFKKLRITRCQHSLSKQQSTQTLCYVTYPRLALIQFVVLVCIKSMNLKIEYEDIFKQKLESKFNLFLGAGFSLLSANEEGKRLPLASELKEELLYKFGKEELLSLDLSKICTILQKTHKQELLDFLKKRFNVSTFNPKYRVLTEFDIQRIITTNIDNLIEKIFSNSKYKCVYDITTRGAKYDFESDTIDYVPLHGSIVHNKPELLFGTTEIASAFRKISDSII